MTYRILGSLVLLAALAASPAHAEGLVLKGRLSVKTAPESDYIVVLYPQQVVVQAAGTQRIYDFNDKHLYVFDNTKRTYVAYPLYTTPVFNHQERAGRLHIAYNAKMSQPGAAAMDFNDFHDVDIDTLYASAEEENTSGLIQTAINGGRTTFTTEGRPLADVAFSENAVPDALKNSYRRYLAYEPVLHPFIEKQILASGKAFSSLHYASGGTETTLTITSVEPEQDSAPMMPQGFTQAYSGDVALDAAIQKAGAGNAPQAAAFDQKISGFTAAKDKLRAALAALDMRLTLGSEVAAQSQTAAAALQAAQADSAAAPAIAATQTTPRTTAEFTQLMEKFATYEKAAPDYAYVLEVFRANNVRAVLENRTAKLSQEELDALDLARHSLSAAISANPWMTEAYCDLGEAYYHAYNIQLAGILWDRAEQINPGFPMLQKITAIRAQAEKDFPEYF